jgi:glycosyltransferase involved in cell wall biosynthesis
MGGLKETKDSKYKGLRMAHVAGKGADGCGVQRTSAEAIIWSKKVGAVTDYYAYDKKFGRADGHDMDIKIFNMKNIKETAQYLNDNYDIVIFMNYPSNKHDHDYSKAFYYDFFMKIENPIKVFMEHDIHKGQIDKTTYLVPMLYNADVVTHFDTDTWFSKTLDDLGIKKINERLFKYTLWMNFDDLDQWRQRYLNKKKPGVVSVTRWSSLKNIRRSIDIMDAVQKRKPDWHCEVYGVERSIGAKFDILDYEKTIYVNPNGNKDNEETGSVCVNGPVRRNDGIDIVASHLFSSSFYSLPKKPENYGNRMEYTQIEIIGAGTIPIFDKHWAQNNKTKDGTYYYDIPYSAIYTDGTDVDEVADKLIEIEENEEEKRKFLETSYNLVVQEFGADTVIPEFIDKVQKAGKNKNQKHIFEIYKELHSSTYSEELEKLEEEGKLPVYGIGELEEGEVAFLGGAKGHSQEHVKKVKRNKGGKIKELF